MSDSITEQARKAAVTECVEEVKRLRDTWLREVNARWDERPDLSFDNGMKVSAANEIISALESLQSKEHPHPLIDEYEAELANPESERFPEQQSPRAASTDDLPDPFQRGVIDID